MGRELEPIDKVAAEKICAIGGLENILLKSATFSSTLHCLSFASMQLQTLPIVHVAIESKNPCN
jgi:ribosome assembly protein 1